MKALKRILKSIISVSYWIVRILYFTFLFLQAMPSMFEELREEEIKREYESTGKLPSWAQ